MNIFPNQGFEALSGNFGIFSKDHDGPLSFTTDDGERFRHCYLALHGRPLYESMLGCDTCCAMYDSLEPSDTPLAPRELSALLAGELTRVTSEIVSTVMPLLPRGKYLVGLLRAIPQHENKESYGSTSSLNYHWVCRKSIRDRVIGEISSKQGCLPWFASYTESEVILPHRTEESYDYRRTLDYQLHGEVWMHTALALSITESRLWGGKYREDRLTHFLLDGHHKTMAASKDGKPLQILSFLNLTMSQIPIWDMTVRTGREYQIHRPVDWLCSGESKPTNQDFGDSEFQSEPI
jgi:hypothetical protein